MTSAELVVRVTELSGKEFQVTLNCDETIFALRQKVSDFLRVPLWKLKLLHRADVLKEGALKDLMEGDETIDVMAVQMATNQEVLGRSQELVKAFKHPFRRQLDQNGRMQVNFDLIKGHTPAIRNGEVDFNFQGQNFLELAISNFPRFFVDEYVNLLLTSGASVNNKSMDRYTPLLSACARGFSKIAETLLQHGANPDAAHHGDDALRSALKFFQACVVEHSCERTEDLRLAKFCCHLRDLKIQRILPTLTPLEQARLKLSQVATEMAVLAVPGFELSQLKVLQKSGLEGVEEDFGAALWAGWPWAFLTFESELPKKCADYDKYFVYARARVMVYHVHESLNKPQRTDSGLDDTSSECSAYSSNYYHCDCPACCSWMYDFLGALENDSLMSHYEAYKEWNRKWDTARNNKRRSRRVPVASGSKHTSYSSRLAKKMPAAYRGFHVERALHGQQRKGGKFQLVQQELDFDLY